MADYNQMTIEELGAENQRLMAEREATRQKQVQIARILDKLHTQREAKRRVAAMSDAEKVALLQVLKPEGIPSEEKFS